MILKKQEAKFVLIDIAHGGISPEVLTVAKQIKQKLKLWVMAGNIATTLKPGPEGN
jgi:hypothetical protein